MDDIESLKIGEIAAVSPYWTPQHIDVTFGPLNYAPPKRSWLDGLEELQQLAPIDSRDRALRRSMNSRAKTTILEIGELPPLEEPEPQTPVLKLVRPRLVNSVRELLRRRLHAHG